jgi:glutamate--cysteine ligase catalytic subunit
MGFLHESEPLSWHDAMDKLRFVREHGIEQFLSILDRCGGTAGDDFRWGDEVEHQVFRLVGNGCDKHRTAKVSLRSPEIIQELKKLEEQQGGAADANWMPEYGRWMLESTPARPYDGLEGICDVESQMRLRRFRLQAALQPGEVAPTITAFPLFGVGDFCEPSLQPKGPAMESLFVPDEAIFPHPRFPTLAQNIRERRGSKVEIRRPMMHDVKSVPAKFVAPDFVPQTVEEADSMSHVFADAMAFGMGASCLQVTMQAADINESRVLYDQLAALTPLLLALTAATPFLRGWICDDDVRWGQVSDSVDDRTRAERGLGPSGTETSSGDSRLAGGAVRPLAKSRYSGIDCYIGEAEDTESFNDIPLVLDEEHVERLMAGGVDKTLARHIAHLFARDPLVLFGDRIDLDDRLDVDHWENLQSTNWQSLRWKPPPPHKGELHNSSTDHIGWRVEVRTMELQMTDFENAAFIAFVVVLSRAILELGLDLRIPMSKLEENMGAAERREACTKERFWFRMDSKGKAAGQCQPVLGPLTIHEILSGTDDFIGLIPVCKNYLDGITCNLQTRSTLNRYLEFIAQRAEGKLLTPATLMRRFVSLHPSYEQDGRVPEAAAHDFLVAASEIGLGRVSCPQLLGDFCETETEETGGCSGCPSSPSSPCEATEDYTFTRLYGKLPTSDVRPLGGTACCPLVAV